MFENTAKRGNEDSLRKAIGWLVVEFEDILMSDKGSEKLFKKSIKEVDGLGDVIALEQFTPRFRGEEAVGERPVRRRHCM